MKQTVLIFSRKKPTVINNPHVGNNKIKIIHIPLWELKKAIPL